MNIPVLQEEEIEKNCNECGIDFNVAPGHRHRAYDKNGKWTSRWLCQNCYSKDKQKNDPNCQRNIIKFFRKRRMGNLDQNSPQAKGDNFQKLTCKMRNIEDLNIKNDNYISPIDHSKDPELGIIQTRGKFYDPRERNWKFGSLEREHKKIFDNIICYCVSKDGKNIERIYIFPKEEVTKRTCITITKNPSRGGYGKNYEPWYEEYRIKDERILKQANKIWIENSKKANAIR